MLAKCLTTALLVDRLAVPAGTQSVETPSTDDRLRLYGAGERAIQRDRRAHIDNGEPVER
jgi:hypothetical protein